MKGTSFSRRELLLGLGGVAVGGALATTVGLGYREYKRRRWRSTRPSFLRPPADDGWLISADERRAVAEGDALVASDVLDIRDAMDIPGGDYESMRVDNLTECVAACEADERCKAFTFARSTHPTEEKRRMCWLKDDGTREAITNTASYVSGRRDGW